MSASLSKSGYLAALQCPRRLWLEAHAPERAAPPDGITTAIRDEARAIGRAAHALFPGGQEVPWGVADAVERTRELLARPDVPAVYEAAFESDRVRIRADVIERLPEGFGLLEVKASTTQRQQHLDDLVIQLWVLRRSGVDVRAVELVLVDGSYVQGQGGLDPQAFFARRDVREDVEFLLADFEKQLSEQLRVLDSTTEPETEPSPHCRRPRVCPFLDRCRADKPDDWIGTLPGLRSAGFHALRDRGIERIPDCPSDAVLDGRQKRAVAAWRDEGGVAVSPRLAGLLAPAGPPAAYLDFETFNPGLPVYPGTRPFEAIPCQWSLHRIEREEEPATHREFLADVSTDPRRAFAESLIEALRGEVAPIIVYSGFEASVLGTLAQVLPDLASGLERIRARLFDLLPVVRSGVYARDFAGSFSLKRVAPALVAGFGYAGLDRVRNGGDAALALTRLWREDPPMDVREQLRAALLRYCARDTQALVEVHRVLRGLC